MSDRYIASTPPSSSRSGAVSSSSTGTSARHLKRLSLSGSAFSPVGNPFESPGTTTATAASPLSSRAARPASALVGSSPAAGAAGGALADRTNSPSLLRRSTSYRAASAGSPATSEFPAVAAAGASSLDATPEHPAHATSTDRSLPTPTRSGSAARVRRGTSISYTGGSTPTRLSLDGGGALREEMPSRASLDSPAARTSSALGLANVLKTDTLVVPQIDSRAHTSPSFSTQPSPALSATSSSTASVATSSAAAAPTPSTLLEQNADLLSIIAKKERKCLDLREELKRNEADLAALKNKWQAIVARSLQAQAYQPYAPFQHRSSPSIATTASTASPNTSPTPQPAVLPHATHSLDLSLLTSTFEPADYNLDGIAPPGHVHGDASPMEIPESVKAAGTWLGGALGRVLEAAVGMPPPLEEEGDDDAGDEYEPPLRRRDVTGLGIVDEEQEEEEEHEPERPRFGTANVNGGLASPPLSSSQTNATSSVAPGPNPLSSPRDTHSSLSPPPPFSRATRSARSPPPPSSSPASTSSSSYGLSSPGTSPTHSRTRSAFSGLLSDKLSSRWAALSSSEMIQSSKRATLGLVDTFEQGLAHALGPLEPPPLPPFEHQQQQQRRRGDEADSGMARARTEEEQQQQRNAQARRLPMPGATPGQGLASLFAAASSTSPRLADHSSD